MTIFCKSCEKTIGKIKADKNNRVSYIEESGILAARFRFDDHWGFECICGNDSRLSEAEKGVITGSMPSAAQLSRVQRNLTEQPTVVTIDDGAIDCDGFIIYEDR